MATSCPTAILVVGMHRSGTSALAGLLDKLGIPLGEHLLAPGIDNPKGYWEHQDVVLVHERLLKQLGSRWDDVRALPEGWLQSDAAREAAAAIGDIIDGDFSDIPVWAVKDPRLCRTLPLWLNVLQQRHIHPVVLFMVRDPREVSASIEARNHWRPLVGTLLWLRYMMEAMTASTRFPREVVLYDDLLADPIASVTAALAKLGVDAGSEISGQQRRVIADFVSRTDRHHTSLVGENSGLGVTAISEKLYQFLTAIAHGIDCWAPAGNIVSEFNQEWEKFGACVDAMADMAARIEQALQSTEADKSLLNSELTAQIRWSEQANAKHEALQANSAELASKLAAQIRWSEQANAKHETLQAENAELASKLTAQIRWSEQANAKHEALHAENAELASKLNAQIRWSDEAQAKYEVLVADHAKLQGQLLDSTKQFQRLESDLEKLQQQFRSVSAELKQAVTERQALATDLRNVYASSSWRVTRPLRSASMLFKNKTGRTTSPTRKP